jgi:hypothetical protein
MAMDAVTPVFREIAAVGAVPQSSLTGRDRELQVEEGRPPIEVAETELEALRRRKSEELREKRKKRQEARRARGPALEGGALEAAPTQEDGEARAAESQQLQENEESQEEETGTLFDDRS